MNPFSADFDPLGLVKGIEPVPWGKVQAAPMLPGYFTWIFLSLGLVAFLVITPLSFLTSASWPTAVFLSLLSVCAADYVATTTIVVRSKRRKKRAEHRA